MWSPLAIAVGCRDPGHAGDYLRLRRTDQAARLEAVGLHRLGALAVGAGSAQSRMRAVYDESERRYSGYTTWFVASSFAGSQVLKGFQKTLTLPQ